MSNLKHFCALNFIVIIVYFTVCLPQVFRTDLRIYHKDLKRKIINFKSKRNPHNNYKNMQCNMLRKLLKIIMFQKQLLNVSVPHKD